MRSRDSARLMSKIHVTQRSIFVHKDDEKWEWRRFNQPVTHPGIYASAFPGFCRCWNLACCRTFAASDCTNPLTFTPFTPFAPLTTAGTTLLKKANCSCSLRNWSSMKFAKSSEISGLVSSSRSFWEYCCATCWICCCWMSCCGCCWICFWRSAEPFVNPFPRWSFFRFWLIVIELLLLLTPFWPLDFTCCPVICMLFWLLSYIWGDSMACHQGRWGSLVKFFFLGKLNSWKFLIFKKIQFSSAQFIFPESSFTKFFFLIAISFSCCRLSVTVCLFVFASDNFTFMCHLKIHFSFLLSLWLLFSVFSTVFSPLFHQISLLHPRKFSQTSLATKTKTTAKVFPPTK